MKHNLFFDELHSCKLCVAAIFALEPASLCAQSSQEILQQAHLQVPGVIAGSRSVDIDGNTAVVGAISLDSGGSAYVFVRNGAQWTLQRRLQASNPSARDGFGTSVAISGDTIVIGAHLEDSSATGVNGNQNTSAPDSGAAYVFVRNGTNWTQQAYLKASNTGVNDFFGARVNAFGDTVIVGAQRESSDATGVNGNQSNNDAPYAGAVYVFVREGTKWSQQAYLKASNTAAGDSFGGSLDVYDDTVIIGADSQGGTGAAYVFVRDGANWSQQAFLKASNAGAGDWFGRLVAIDEDTVVVGATVEDSNAIGVNGDQANNSAQDSGAAYVFVRNGTNWSQQAYLKASNTERDDMFGSVGIFGDTIVVGATWEASSALGVNGDQSDNSTPFAGAAYVFMRSGTSWSLRAYLKASNTFRSGAFGGSPRISGDTLIVGGQNSAYVFSGLLPPSTNCPPSFILQPANQLVLPGADITLLAAVRGPGPTYYQWSFEGTPIPGATNATYSFTNVSLTNGHGNYSVVASNEFGATTSSNASIFVLIPPRIATQPVTQVVLEGQNAAFTCVATGAPPIFYRWFGTGVIPFTNTTGRYVYSNVLASVTTAIRCQAINAAGWVLSASAGLIMLPDFDRDGMPDAWESQYLFDTNNAADASIDLDGDGLSNRDEYNSGTDPLDAESVLELTIVRDSGILLRFIAQSNLAYALQFQTHLARAAPWQLFSNVAPSATTRLVEIHDLEVGGGTRFYRLRTPAESALP